MSPNCRTSASRPRVSTLTWKALLLRHRWLVQHAGRDLHVLRPQRRHHLAGGQVARGDLLRIEPDAHRIVARAQHLHVAHAVDARQHVLDLQGRVVGDVELVARSVRRAQMDHHHQVRRILAHRDAEPPHFLRQPRLGHGDAVLHQHLGDVEVGAEREGYGERQLPSLVACDDMYSMFSTPLISCSSGVGDRLRYHLGGGAGIAGAARDRRRRDLGILRDRQA